MNPNCLHSRVTTALIFVAVALTLGCAHLRAPARSHVAVVERIDEQEGEHHSPEKRLRPLFRIRLRLVGESSDYGADVLRVLLLDFYSTETYGDIGDTVSFSYPGKLPIDGVVWFEQLNNFKLTGKKKANQPLEPTR